MAMTEQMKLDRCGVSLDELERAAVLCLQTFAPTDAPYYGCFSGGKDSVVIKEIARRSGVAVDWHYNVTTIDPPELCKFIKREHPDVTWEHSKHGNFFKRMLTNGFPTRRARWCCEEYKESQKPQGRRMLLGIRAAESPRRRNAWKQVTAYRGTGEWAINPIISWTDDDVWAYIRSREIAYCSLYDEGFMRLGCVGCPMSTRRRADFARWPRFERLWRKAFKGLWEKRVGKPTRDGREWFGSAKFDTWEEMFEWWISNDPLPTEDDECDGLPLV
jgi:phosphoadenosine phosphosulfate reductase